ncbi:MAG: signal peptidase II [Firmicutes bacterium]|nr:signal peptidase II [Bacillota bacterium]
MLFFSILFISICDQLIKVIISKNLYITQSIPVINNFFRLTYIHNRGAGFGILAGYKNLFILLSIIIIVLLLIYRNNCIKNNFSDLAIGLIIGGALGNLVDRIRLGYVIDYLDFRIWPVFNLADTAIVTGTFLFIIYYWGVEKDNG